MVKINTTSEAGSDANELAKSVGSFVGSVARVFFIPIIAITLWYVNFWFLDWAYHAEWVEFQARTVNADMWAFGLTFFKIVMQIAGKQLKAD